MAINQLLPVCINVDKENDNYASCVQKQRIILVYGIWFKAGPNSKFICIASPYFFPPVTIREILNKIIIKLLFC